MSGLTDAERAGLDSPIYDGDLNMHQRSDTVAFVVERIIAARVAAAEQRIKRVQALWGGGEHPPVFITGTKVVRATSRRRDLGCDVTESFLRLNDVVAALARPTDEATP